MPKAHAIAGMITSVDTALPPLSPSGIGIHVPLPPLVRPARVSVTDDAARFEVELPPMAPWFHRWAIQRSIAKRRPLYITESNGVVVDVKLPIVGRVTRFDVDATTSAAHVALDSSPRRLVIPDVRADERVAALLQRASHTGGIVMVTADDDSTIVDADPAPSESWFLAPMFEAAGAERLSNIPVTVVDADALDDAFALVSSDACSPVPPPVTCIPFNFPDDGCEARAHKMCQRLLAARNLTAGKVWLFDVDLFISTRNTPACAVHFTKHVGIFLRVAGSGNASVRVMDPALFPNGAVKLRKFVDDLHASMPLVKFSRAKFYQIGLNGSGSLERQNECEDDLDDFRQKAAARIPQPPYC